VAPSSREYVCEKFSEFYRNPSNVIPAPTATSQREFAYLLFRERAMIRHRAVVKISSLRNLFNENVPSDVYHSCAYYEYPEADMDKKGWLGADLVFDIDADHIPTDCDKVHDEWTCRTCDFSGKGVTPEECPICGGLKFDAKTWPCERCVDSARNETIKLLDILEKDFGFAAKDLHVFFSGHRGYHVHVEDEAVKPLDAMARKEIVDYVYGTGLLGLEQPRGEKKPKRKVDRGFSLHDFGWNKRIKLGMQKFILNATEEDLKEIGVASRQAKGIVQNKEAIATRYIEENRWKEIKGVNAGPETWLKIARHVKDLESSKIDTVVTTDIHRLIRMNGTLHGKTGLKKVEFPANRLTSFDPFKEAVAFKEGTVKLSVSSAPEFRIGEDMFGPYKNKTVELPTAAAVLLILKGRAGVEDTQHV
jgi:DNA primase small subunit